MPEGFGALAILNQELTQVYMCVGVVRFTAESRAKSSHGAEPVSLPQQALAQVVMGRRKIGLELHGLAKVRRRFTVVSEQKANASQVERGLDRSRRQPGSRAQSLLSSTQIIFRKVCPSQQQPATARVGIVLHGLLEQGDRVVDTSLAKEAIPARHEALS